MDNLSFEAETVLEEKHDEEINFWKIVDEFYEYINSNKSFIVNYGERHHHGELIATEFNKPISAFNFGRTLFYHYHRFCP